MVAISVLLLLILVLSCSCISESIWGGYGLAMTSGACAQVSSRMPAGSVSYCGQSINIASLCRPHSVSITEFGAIGDGVTPNTHAFQNAIFYLRSFADKGGAQLYVPRGKWLTGSFNLTSHLTLYLDEGAVILASQDPTQWPVIGPLPSYGQGRELNGARHISLIHGENLTDVVITGKNGTIDGQGLLWWEWSRTQSLNYSRGHLVELINSKNVVVSNLTFLNSPFWTIHPVYCSNVVVRDVMVVTPANSPDTDGIVPDSCTHVCIEDCYISTGANAIAIKSGWDDYESVSFWKESADIVVRRVVGEAPSSAVIAFGTEMSGGISNIQVEELVVRNSKTGIRLTTAAGRGGYVTNVSLRGIVMHNVVTAFEFTALYSSSNAHLILLRALHDPPASYPVVEKILITNTVGENISHAGDFKGLSMAPFKDICLMNISLEVISGGFDWNCSGIQGFSTNVFPQPCSDLRSLADESVCRTAIIQPTTDTATTTTISSKSSSSSSSWQ
ncbi:hypothetical protein O6H91_10G001400 [Diphasiastrum complanatum]|uniref:Uncharacterized protein n=5 Tax=Diphasiastrum complanatum TaxID=34168 RepID=A0ACC2CDJ1_DIPCM|nr:hypothetical protein O6H91_10G001400 [Diphasiastrum complanatum]KAJ7540100.1 hypothetical protein O6H91_10G001400 [Diphasiastrum complanatum]KAJ7540101.1 hypothetical protein O6H91_10G001400 [Diphasiastrum complanatum]KAJ7540102.1 hypothetical protein O6H91_10G001400 [Diphasiastrum complanatum]KAJ7540103.1 hypothetical protein O6H91_10G001400 [Diphasiastrum complanatum]